jgi:hypothetical protein
LSQAKIVSETSSIFMTLPFSSQQFATIGRA